MNRIKPIHIPILINLLLLGAGESYLVISASELGKKIGKSQQSTSIYLSFLEEIGLIERSRNAGRSSIKITQDGINSMNEIYSILKRIFEEKRNIFQIKGTLFSGLGEGAYYMSLKGYRTQFIKKLGFDPYPGTLNIRIEMAHFRKLRKQLETIPGIKIDGFSDTDRTYGEAKCFFAEINKKINGAVIFLERTHYDDSVIEFIASLNIRSKLNLKDGSEIIIEVKL